MRKQSLFYKNMSEKYKSPEEISQYMGERLKRENKGEFVSQAEELSPAQIEEDARGGLQ